MTLESAQQNRGTLTVVSTPIGNPGDITLRAIEILTTADLIAAEDARVSRPMLDRLGIRAPLISLTPRGTSEISLLQHLQKGAQVALLCDAGTPLVADPGGRLCRDAAAAGIAVRVAPGASALLAALVLSCLNVGRFAFDGFAPRTAAGRARFFRELRTERRALVLFESRAMLASTLAALAEALGGARPAAVIRDATKPTEAVFRGDLAEACARLGHNAPRGEYTIVTAGRTSRPAIDEDAGV